MADADLAQQAFTRVLEHFIETGHAPHYAELAGQLGTTPDEAKAAQREAAESAVACWFAADTDYVESWPPFSNTPTGYYVSVEGEQKWYGQ